MGSHDPPLLTPTRGSAIWIVLAVVFLLGADLNVTVAEAGPVMWPVGVSVLALAAAGWCIRTWIREDQRVPRADVDDQGRRQVVRDAKHR